MSTVHRVTNTDKTYPCTTCGSKNISIVREAPTLELTRVKCNTCNFMYSAADSLGLSEKGEIPSGPPAIQDPIQRRGKERGEVSETESSRDASVGDRMVEHHSSSNIPRTPSFVFVSKDRSHTEFCTKRYLKKTTLAWEHRGFKYDVFELCPRKVSANIDIK